MSGRQLLIAFLPETRPIGRPIKCNKETLDPVDGIHIDNMGSLKDWYLDALDDTFWNKCIDHLRDPVNNPVPERPNRDAAYNGRRSRRNRNQDQNEPRRNQYQQNRQNVSPPRRRNRSERRDSHSRENNSSQNYDPAQVGVTLWDSLKIFDLGHAATYAEVKAQYRSMARIYHPDQHNPARTGMTNDQAKEFFQLINNAHEFLKSRM